IGRMGRMGPMPRADDRRHYHFCRRKFVDGIPRPSGIFRDRSGYGAFSPGKIGFAFGMNGF
ncbi:MAG TPA: hypothetical protein VNX46_05410, partial [Candidatus Acidoferrum sp.]|nr:hypothetical protein [Candidatus Acidoferrum sp.]